MSLAIGKLALHCRTTPPLAATAGRLERVVRERLAAELRARLGPSLDRDDSVVRIRRLPLRVVLRGPRFDDEAMLAAWLDAFVEALFRMLAYPAGEGPGDHVRWNSRADQLAALAADALAGTASSGWQWSELRASGALDDPRRIFALCSGAAEMRALLIALESQRLLEPLVRQLDDLQLEQLFRVLAPASSPSLTIELVAAVARLAADWRDDAHAAEALTRATANGGSGARRVALRLYAFGAARGNELPARSLFHALLALVHLADLSTGDASSAALPPSVAAFVAEARAKLQLAGDGSPAALRHAVATVRTLLAPGIAAVPATPDAAPWIGSEVAGLLLLLPWAQRLGWNDRQPFELAAIARQIVQLDHVDPAVALFAGCTGDFDHAGFARFLEHADHDAIRESAAALIDAFRLRIRGFRNAPHDAVVRQFLRKPGRFQVEERNVTVVLDASPFHVALHISSLDEAVASLAWLGGRSVTFVLGGLA